MADLALTQQLRHEIQNKFNLTSNGKKRKASFGEPLSKKQKLSHTKTSATNPKSKQSMIAELKKLGLVNQSHHTNYNRPSLPQRNNKWKQNTQNKKPKNQSQNKKHKMDSLNQYNSQRPAKRRKIDTNANIHKLHKDITIYPFKPHLWYNIASFFSQNKNAHLLGYTMPKKAFLKTNNTNEKVLSIARALYTAFTERDRIKNEFHSFTLHKGTFRDRISTMVLRIQQCSLSRLTHLSSILDILSQNTKRQSIHIIPLLNALFVDKLLPERHLCTFNEQIKTLKSDKSMTHISQMHLILFYFEHLLKQKYKYFIELLEYYSCNSQIEKLKYIALLALYKLLMFKPENESILLSLLINKFGENDRDFSNKMREYLLKIAGKHPLMKPEIIREMNNYLLRPALSPKGLYRAVLFLSKLRFTSLETEAATLLCGIYMDLFKNLINYQNIFDELNECKTKQQNSDSHFVDSNVFKYIFDNNRTFVNQSNNQNLSEFNKNISIKNAEFGIMKKLVGMTRKKRNIYFKTHLKELIIWKRFLLFEEITPKLLSCILRGISYVFPFANLNLTIFKRDLDYIYKLILKSNMKICVMALQFTFSVESTFETAISGTNITDKTPTQVVKYGRNRQNSVKRREICSDRFYQILYSVCMRWDFVVYSNPQILFNLLYQCIKYDTNKVRVIAFVRRLIQFCSHGSVSWICGILYLCSAVIKIHPFLSNMFELNAAQLSMSDRREESEYSLTEFEPKLSHANLCPFWELNTLLYHMHPIVRDFSKQLIENKYISYNGDPLNDFKRKVLFEKFTRIMAHKMKEFKPRNTVLNESEQKKDLINSHLSGDGFIAIYKQHTSDKRKEIRKDERDSGGDSESENETENDILADEAMFNWLKSHYGNEIPDDRYNEEEEYDYSEFKQEIKKMERTSTAAEEEMDSDIDVYLSDDIERDNDENETEFETEMSEKEKEKIGNEMVFESIKNENIILPNDVEYESDAEMSSEENGNANETDHLQFLKEESESEDDDIGDFFGEQGFGAGQLNVD